MYICKTNLIYSALNEYNLLWVTIERSVIHVVSYKCDDLKCLVIFIFSLRYPEKQIVWFSINQALTRLQLFYVSSYISNLKRTLLPSYEGGHTEFK